MDLYLEHLVAMAVELGDVRARLVPLLFLPLDSQILAHPGLFTEQELAGHGWAVHLNSVIQDEDDGSQREERLDRPWSFDEAMRYSRLGDS